jgi:hypothetical protein
MIFTGSSVAGIRGRTPPVDFRAVWVGRRIRGPADVDDSECRRSSTGFETLCHFRHERRKRKWVRSQCRGFGDSLVNLDASKCLPVMEEEIGTCWVGAFRPSESKTKRGIDGIDR